MKRNILLVTILLLSQSCDDSEPTDDVQENLASRNEATRMAFRFSNTLRAPEELVESIFLNMERIRGRWRSDIPQLDEIRYRSPWKDKSIHISFDREYSEGAFFGYFPNWDSLNTVFAVDSIGRVEGTYQSSYVVLMSDSLFNVEFMASVYSTIDGIEGACPNHYMGDYSNAYPSFTGGVFSVLFREAWGYDCPAGCENNIFWYFKCHEDSVEFVGSFNPAEDETPLWWEDAVLNMLEFY